MINRWLKWRNTKQGLILDKIRTIFALSKLYRCSGVAQKSIKDLLQHRRLVH